MTVGLSFIALVNYIPRKTVVGWSFLSLAILFVIPGVLLLSHAQANDGTAQKALFVICQVIFNAGKVLRTIVDDSADLSVIKGFFH